MRKEGQLGVENLNPPKEVTGRKEWLIALAGNPNTGKTTLFNALTGLNQHTGNWPGKTVVRAEGFYWYRGQRYRLIDLPGTYSLLANSPEEEITRAFLYNAQPQVTVVVADASALERNLNLILQLMSVTPRLVVAVNLVDEAQRRGIEVDAKRLSQELGVPVVAISARWRKGLDALQEVIRQVAEGELRPRPKWLFGEGNLIQEKRLPENPGPEDLFQGQPGLAALAGHSDVSEADATRERVVQMIFERAATIAQASVVSGRNKPMRDWDRFLDDLLTSPWTGYPVMLALLGIVFWITLIGANYPSEILASALFWLEDRLWAISAAVGMPTWFSGFLIHGAYRSLAWVVSVMLPPMAIFFPLFALLEDLGFLPRVAFNLDHFFKCAGSHGKQALTMSMGFGCNAAGVVSCRIIDSPRERLIAVLTNNFVPCNGRFPLLITLAALFFGQNPGQKGWEAAALVVGLVLLGIVVTLFVSWLLAHTLLRGIPASFALELPPFRRPDFSRILIRSFLDRTVFVLARAAVVAAPAGAFTWLLAQPGPGGESCLRLLANWLEPLGRSLGMDGFILSAFFLGLPANEIVLPILLMGYSSAGMLVEFGSREELHLLLVGHGWTWVTAMAVMLFSLLHFPCATTLWTIKKETGSWKWTVVAALLPTTVAVLVTFTFTTLVRLWGV